MNASKRNQIEIIVVAVVIISGISSWALKADSFFSDDSYFYLVISRNIARFGKQTFSFITTTNGVHPLWIYLLAIYASIIRFISDDFLNSASFVVPLTGMLSAGGGIIVYRTAKLLSISALPVTLLPICYLMGFGVLGSEGILFFFLLSLVSYCLATFDYRRYSNDIYLGLLCAAVTLSRLDSIFIVPSILVLIFLRTHSLRAVLLFTGMFLLITIPYLFTNIYFFGGIMPISGWIKSSFPDAHFKGIQMLGIKSNISGYSILFGIVPIISSITALFFRKQCSKRATEIVLVFISGCVFQFFYVALFTRFHTLWYWYYVLPIFTLGYTLSMSLEIPVLKRLKDFILVGYVFTIVFAFIVLQTDKYYIESEHISPSYLAIRFINDNKIHNKTIFVSDHPGKTAFYTNNRIVAADMLTSNIRFYKEMVSSGNSLTWMLSFAKKARKPIKYIMFLGHDWILSRTANQEIIHNDPKHIPKMRPIGKYIIPESVTYKEISKGGSRVEVYVLPQ